MSGNMNGDMNRRRSLFTRGFRGPCSGFYGHVPVHGKCAFFAKHHPYTSPETTLDWLEWASNAFCHGDEIFAGYHWFCESWGRGFYHQCYRLVNRTRAEKEARAVIKRLFDMSKDGVIPNRFPDNYHTSDASLWFIQALLRYRRRWGDDHFMEKMKPSIQIILENYPSSSCLT